MYIKGNYWLNLLEKESNLKKEIETTIKRSVGKKFLDYQDMVSKIKSDVRTQLENYGIKYHLGVFHLEYDFDLTYDKSFILSGYNVKYVLLEEDVW